VRPVSKSEIRNLKSESLYSSYGSRFNHNWLSLSAILLSVVVLSFWHFRQTEWRPAHRAFSTSNQNDFSWRNRITAWEGGLQMMAENPWFGFGWNRPEPMYEHYYLQPKSTESAAIQMNDYLMFGATLGIPALFCFGMYLWLSLGDGRWEATSIGHRAETRNWKPGSERRRPNSDFLSITCRAGAIVLLVGFWFDGGLFKLATASTFWILLELGHADLVPQKATEETKADSIPG
jgi:O-antigen ligase